MRKLLLAGATLLALETGAAWAQSPPIADVEFVKKASVGNAFEVEESKVALERATDPRVKDYARKMIADHTDAENKLKAAAGEAGQRSEMVLDPPHQAMLDNLKNFNGTDFDKIYTADQIQAHVETVALLLDYQQNGTSDDLKSWAKTSAPIVKGHLAAIDAM